MVDWRCRHIPKNGLPEISNISGREHWALCGSPVGQRKEGFYMYLTKYLAQHPNKDQVPLCDTCLLIRFQLEAEGKWPG